MRIQFITEQIAIGGAMNDQSAFDQVKAKGITHIIDLEKGCDVRWTDEAEGVGVSSHRVEVLHYYLPDDGKPKPYRWFAAPVEFALDVLAEGQRGAIDDSASMEAHWGALGLPIGRAQRPPEAKLFIHCAAGRSRSVSIAYAILRCLGYSKRDALSNIGFKYSLPLSIRDMNFKAIRRVRYEEDADRFIEARKASAEHQRKVLAEKRQPVCACLRAFLRTGRCNAQADNTACRSHRVSITKGIIIRQRQNIFNVLNAIVVYVMIPALVGKIVSSVKCMRAT